MREWPIYIDETPTMNIMQMRAKLRRIAKGHDGKIGVALVDYLQLMQAVEKTTDRQREVAEIAVGLKSLSKVRLSGCGAVAIEPQGIRPAKQASDDVRPARIWVHRTGGGLDFVHLPG